MTKLGLIARADDGGLGNMTWEFFRAMRPDRTMVVDLGALGRGPVHLERYPGATIVRGMNDDIPPEVVAKFCSGLDVVYTAETFYRDDFCAIARSVGCKTILHAMPELYRRDQAPADEVWVPTSWELHRMPQGTVVVPVPVARDRSERRLRTEAARFLVLGAPAFHDRNGFSLAVDACAEVTQPLSVLFAGTPQPPPIRTEVVSVSWDPTHVDRYWSRYNDADVLLMPRRYAGLSLPMQEAAEAGMAIVSLDLPPQNRWLPAEALAHATEHHNVAMVGGLFPVHTTVPAELAKIMDALATSRDLVEMCSIRSLAYANSISWEALSGEYRQRFEWVSERHKQT
jgi:hypothetical protein